MTQLFEELKKQLPFSYKYLQNLKCIYSRNSLLSKMSMFTLAIFCLTSSNLPGFIIFKVLMQYCSLQHQTLLSSLDTSKTVCHFIFGSAFLFPLVIFLHSSPAAHWTPTHLGILAIRELKWMGMVEFNSDDYYIYYSRQESLTRNGVALIVNKSVWNAVLWCNLKNEWSLLVSKANHSISQ